MSSDVQARGGSSMTLNGIEKIKDEGGDFIVLVDYGCEGLSVWSQHETAKEAIKSLASYVGSGCLVRLVRVDLAVTEAGS